MANADKPNGFKVGYTKHGGPAALNRYFTSGTAAIYIGDVLMESTVTGHVKNIAASSEVPMGISGTYTASTDITTEVLVYDDLQNTVFIGQDSGSALLGSSMTMAHYDLTVTVSTATQLSNMEINSGASTSDNVLLIDKVERPDNAWGANVDCYVEFLVHDNVHSRTMTSS